MASSKNRGCCRSTPSIPTLSCPLFGKPVKPHVWMFGGWGSLAGKHYAAPHVHPSAQHVGRE
eukprot:6405908-Alexandrium_andersonii.AAC.1